MSSVANSTISLIQTKSPPYPSSSRLFSYFFSFASPFVCLLRNALWLTNCSSYQLLLRGNTCTKLFSTSRNLRDHIKNTHGYIFPNNIKSTRRFNTKLYFYLRYRPPSGDGRVKNQFVYPCCTDHFNALDVLANHSWAMHSTYLPPQQQQRNYVVITADEDEGGDDSSHGLVNSKKEATTRSKSRKRPNAETFHADNIVFLPPDRDRTLVDGFDVSQASFYFQFSLKDEKWKLSLEQNLHLALTTTSILLVTPNKYPDDLQQFFSVDEWTGYLQQNT